MHKAVITNADKDKVMGAAKKVINARRLINFFICSMESIFLILGLWAFFNFMVFLGCPFPSIAIEKFFDLGFFSLSTFSFIIFLTLIPFQTSEGKLSPGFYSRMLRSPRAHLGLYVLMVSGVASFAVLTLPAEYQVSIQLDLLFMALVGSIVVAILFHRIWVLRSLYQPYTVYQNIEKLTQEETRGEVWLELLECTYKAIAGFNIGNAKNFLKLMSLIYQRSQEKAEIFFGEDLRHLYKTAGSLRPVARYMEEKWPFLNSSHHPEIISSSDMVSVPLSQINIEKVVKN